MNRSTAAPAQSLPLGFAAERPLPLRLLAALGTFARNKPLGFFGLMVIVVLVVLALLAPQIAPFSPDQTNLHAYLAGPSATHWLGTDATGRDIFSRLIFGARVSMAVGFGAVALTTVFAVALGMIAASSAVGSTRWCSASSMRCSRCRG